jgi:hypothetical protein
MRTIFNTLVQASIAERRDLNESTQQSGTRAVSLPERRDFLFLEGGMQVTKSTRRTCSSEEGQDEGPMQMA